MRPFGAILVLALVCLLTYQPRGVDTAGWHNISVKVKGRSADVTARGGYQR